jgi:hypothetical protein
VPTCQMSARMSIGDEAWAGCGGVHDSCVFVLVVKTGTLMREVKRTGGLFPVVANWRYSCCAASILLALSWYLPSSLAQPKSIILGVLYAGYQPSWWYPRTMLSSLMSMLTIEFQLRAVRRAWFGNVASANVGSWWATCRPVNWAYSASAKARKMNQRKGSGSCLLFSTIKE